MEQLESHVRLNLPLTPQLQITHISQHGAGMVPVRLFANIFDSSRPPKALSNSIYAFHTIDIYSHYPSSKKVSYQAMCLACTQTTAVNNSAENDRMLL